MSRTTDAPPGRIVILSAAVGAGHDGAANELAERLRAAGHRVERRDVLDLLPVRTGRLLAAAYHHLLTVAPAGYDRLYAATEQTGRPSPAIRGLLRAAEGRALRTLPADTALVVSTYPGASQLLGRLRRTGALAVPAVTYLTDFSVHRLWVAPGIDLHLAAHSVPAAQALARGAGRTRVCPPAVRPCFAPAGPAARRAARTRFGLPQDARLALLVAGSWGVGEVERAAAEVRGSGVAEPVVVCGRNRVLAERLRALGLGYVHGWVEDMPALMHACDVLVQNAGGLTSLEALAAGLPVVSYRCIPGHGRTNAAALDEAGLARWIREPSDLRSELADLLDTGGHAARAQRTAAARLFASGPAPEHLLADLATAPCGPQHVTTLRPAVFAPVLARPEAAPLAEPGPSVPVPQPARPAPAGRLTERPDAVPHFAPARQPGQAPPARGSFRRRTAPARPGPSRARALLVGVGIAATLLLGVAAPAATADPGGLHAFDRLLDGDGR
ncbi:MGDG synthase family glycosyltransferase [Actinacidiphila guanduensis]|uniref:UDP-N-acetylglucosamine:LPS N-acetylglucosamine transferase n=1 Tax=Actinacidiphila guanduensis TaxID=310781 RepID=A0A1G9VQY3_9ACTN|nr:glycosyltransferase [Actinacidiphila guanduensis]SDM74624.1 UDP-N-acetylglucosamine:LPS N-acetylglucosamine transferase [Actinacidiphila guanduensis]